MAAPAINRLVLTDDDGTGLTGTPLNNALFQDLQNRIDQLSAAIVAQFPAPGNIVTTVNLPGAMQNVTRTRTLVVQNVPASTVDRSLYDAVVLWDCAQPITINAPTWSGAGGVGEYWDASLVYSLRDAGTPQAITWNAAFVPMAGIPLPAMTSGWAWTHAAFRYSAAHRLWFCVALTSSEVR